MPNINDAAMVMVLLSYFSRYWRTVGRTDRRTNGLTEGRSDSHVTTKTFYVAWLPNFLRYGAPLARLWRAGVPLITILFHDLFKCLCSCTI